MKELAKNYNPSEFEDKIYQNWIDKKYFHAVIDNNKKPYTIVIPPPNITGQLHMGHAYTNTLQDILIRYKRMQGYCALYLPGTDHASIATEAKIVEDMKNDGVTKDDLGRDGFLKRAWEWKEKYGNRIVHQLKKLGYSCDWDRLRFTLDEGCNKAVNKVFADLYKAGKIYRAERIINWCPKCCTSVSDIEVEHTESKGHFWHIKYPISGTSEFLEVATTRPETMLGDTALAVNPDDKRYKQYVGKTAILPLMNREIPIIADEYVDMEFGTGVVKITPAHDPNDFEVGQRHKLPLINVMDENAVINENGGKYKGMERYKARKAVVADLDELGLLVKVQDHTHNVGGCQRCGTTVEPMASLQWFVKMESLAKPAVDVVNSGELKFVPERFTKIYINWMENIRDWCISRQLWWGHRIPAYYCENSDCSEVTVSETHIDTCPKCGSEVKQDEDTLDTWFSSALWPFSTLGWPDKTADLEYFYPTNTLVTAYDIIFFWVARMIFSGLGYTGQKPFDAVFMHGLIRDEQGRKMSKSLGNGIDPLEIIEKYGADALRFMLVNGNATGNDIRWSEARLNNARNFANKLWNASRYIIMNLPDEEITLELPKVTASEDKWILSMYNNLVKEVTANFDGFELGIAGGKIYDFTWDYFCDWYIELTKPRIQEGGESKKTAQSVLVYIMDGILKLLHPFMPFITEEIYTSMPVKTDTESIMIADYPKYTDSLNFEKEQTEFDRIIAAIKAIRAGRAEINVPPSVKASIYIETGFKDIFAGGLPFFKKLAFAESVEISDKYEIEGALTVVTDSCRIFIPMSQLIDKEKETARLNKEKSVVMKDIEFLSGKLNNEKFISKAPPQLVQAEKDKLKAAEEKLEKINESLAKL